MLRGLQPRAFVMENVSGMVKGLMKLVFSEALRELKASGYRVRCWKLNAMHYGVPQSRERMIFIGLREDLGIEPTAPAGLRQVIGLRRGWGKVEDGVKNKQFKNQWRSLDLPCVTLEKTRPPIVLENGSERELTLIECAAIGSYPPAFKWGKRAYQRIGNSVPPLFMRAIAEHVAGLLRGAA